MRSVIVYGPQGCGKSKHAQAMLKHFKLRYVVEADDMEYGKDFAAFNTLYLTSDEKVFKRSYLSKYEFEKIKEYLK